MNASAPDRPGFIIGCGRAGTTILGHALAVHPSVAYLNEPRDVWEQALPETDIWSAEARFRGKLYLDESALTARRRRELNELFAKELQAAGRQRLVEKIPENAFRARMIAAAFPGATFIHIVRNPLEVARSIAKACEDSRNTPAPWYGVEDAKWYLMVEYCLARDAYRGLPALCEDDFDRGLLEWRLSVEAGRGFCETLPAACLEVRYEDLLIAPVDTLRRVQQHLELPISEAVEHFAASSIHRFSPPADGGTLPASAGQILGCAPERLGYA